MSGSLPHSHPSELAQNAHLWYYMYGHLDIYEQLTMERLSRINKSIPTPLYYQLEQILREEITRGRFPIGRPIPPEMELAKQYGLSRYTTRQAIDRLVREGLLERHRGRGTYVTKPRLIEQSLAGFYSFAHEMQEKGLSPRSEVLEASIVPPSEEVREKLQLEPGEAITRVKRLRFAEEEPLILEITHLPTALVPGILEEDLRIASLYDLLETKYGLSVTSARELIKPVVVRTHEARLLRMSRGSAAFFVERLAWSERLPVEWRQSLIRGDRYLYSIELPRNSAGQIISANF
ncbi:MAG: GntR family transcriptional regulator [Chloroflexi bacterium]|nr:GntR family transcriptional regulator [Chloroflexota bacterium]MCL5075564.1 GntR family transcriptional regulator [Chloroflexota bacterium]